MAVDGDQLHPADEIVQLSESECWTLIQRSDVGRLAVSIGDHPDIFPVNHIVDDGAVVFRSGAGTKLAASVLGKAVAFEVDGFDGEAGEAWSVVVKGRARLVENMWEMMEADDLPLFPWHRGPKPNVVRIEPDEITGRRFYAAGRVDRPD